VYMCICSERALICEGVARGGAGLRPCLAERTLRDLASFLDGDGGGTARNEKGSFTCGCYSI